MWHSIWQSLWDSIWHSIWRKLRRDPQRFSTRKSPATPIETVALQKSGETHGDQELAGAIQRGGRWSPASLTALTSWQVMFGKKEVDEEEEEEEEEEQKEKEKRRTSWYPKI